MKEHDAAFEAALPEPALTRKTRPCNAFNREDVSFLREHFPDGKDVALYTIDQMRAIWTARGEADARVCEAIAANSRSANWDLCATSCATAIRGMK